MGVTMRDVALVARVSPKTVSNVVNGHPHVHPLTRARVQQAITDLGYRPNLSARGLRSGRTGVIGLAVPELQQTYFAELADAVIAAAGTRNLGVIVSQAGGDRQREEELLTNGLKQTDGLLFSPEWLGFDDRGLLDNLGFPLVMLGERIFGGSVDQVMMHNVSASRAAVEHLIAVGRRRIAVVGAHPGDRTEHLPPADSRVQGYRDALVAADLPLDRRLERAVAPWHPQNGADATRELLDSGVDFDAIFALTDELAFGVLRALGESGRTVPDDVAVMGFDNLTIGRFMLPSLSSVDPGRDEIAETAVRMLVERMEGSAPSRAPRIHKAGFHIVARESTGGTTPRTEPTDPRESVSPERTPVNGVPRPHAS